MLKTINGGKMPTRGTEFSACVDLYANDDVVIGAGETVVIPLGVCIDLDKLKDNYIEFNRSRDLKAGLPPLSKTFENKYFNNEFLSSNYLQLMLRSSLGKKGLILPNGVGVIDMDFISHCKINKHLNNGQCEHFKPMLKE